MTLESATARALETALWAAIVELAEAAHQAAIDGQARPRGRAAFTALAADLDVLAKAAAVARRGSRA